MIFLTSSAAPISYEFRVSRAGSQLKTILIWPLYFKIHHFVSGSARSFEYKPVRAMVGLFLDISKKFNMVHTFQRKFISPPQTSASAAVRGKISKTFIQTKCIYLNHALFELRPLTYKTKEMMKATEKKRAQYMKRSYDVR